MYHQMTSVKTLTVYLFQTIIAYNKVKDFLDDPVSSNDTLFHSKQIDNIQPKIKEKITISPINNILHLSTITIGSSDQQRMNHHEKLNNSSSIHYQTDNQIITSNISENPEIIINDSLSNKSKGKNFLLNILHQHSNCLISCYSFNA